MNSVIGHRAITAPFLVAFVVTIGSLLGSTHAVAKDSEKYTGITQKVFDECIKPKEKNKTGEGWAEYAEGNKGGVKLKSETWGFTSPADLSFEFSPGSNTLTYTLIRIQWLVPKDRIWSGFKATVDKCKQQTN